MRARRAPEAVVLVYGFALGADDKQGPVLAHQHGDEELPDLEEGRSVDVGFACPVFDAFCAIFFEAGVERVDADGESVSIHK